MARPTETCYCPICKGATRQYGPAPFDPGGKMFGMEHVPLPLPHEVGNKMSQIYMLIDITTVEETRVVLLGTMRQVQLHGLLLKSQGRQVVGPPLMGRGFGVLEKLNLQYLFWNHCKRTPPEDYRELAKECFTQISFMKPDATPVEELEKMAAKLIPQGEVPPAHREKKAYDPAKEYSRPKATTSTGLVWILADELMEALGTMPERKQVLAACEQEGINQATASTQYSKWARAKREAGSK